MRTVFVLLLIGLITEVSGQTADIRSKHFNISDGLAIKGYDPVTYFTLNKAVKGEKKYSARYAGVVYYFSSEKTKELFVKDPAKYEPQYGGWCAYAMGNSGEKVEIDPQTFKIIGGKLYLFYKAYFNNTLTSWNKNEKNLKTKADKNWSEILEK